MIKNISKIYAMLMLLPALGAFAQQDPQYTQYMYNTLTVNSAYAGSLGHLAVTGIYRTQWVGLEGSPDTQTLTVDFPLQKNVGLGISIVNDKIGPSLEQYMDANFSYTIQATDSLKLAFGVKGGVRLLNIDWSKGSYRDNDVQFQENINNKFMPVIGAGVYLYGNKSYIGLSIPNFLTDQQYNDIKEGLVDQRIHTYLIGGMVFDLSVNTRFKPAMLVKYVSGAPLVADLSANFLFYEKFTLGASYRTGDALSAIASFQISPKLLIGYAYDYTTTEIQNYSSGSHELMLRFELVSGNKESKAPRFF
jgi:type IX secretion system PorP/SprF family membrane protein